MKSLRKPFSIAAVVAVIGVTSCTYNTTTKDSKKDSVENHVPKAAIQPDGDTNTSNHQGSKPAEKVSDAWLLVPGQSAGLTRLNENAETVYKKLGDPDGGDAAMQKAVAIWYTNHDSTNHSVAIYTAREPGVDPVARIRQIRITSPSFKTAEGVGPGSSLAQIQAAFNVKETEQYKDEGIAYKVYDSPKGIAFETGPGGGCVAVVIHEAGVTGQGTYLKFRTTNKFISQKKG